MRRGPASLRGQHSSEVAHQTPVRDVYQRGRVMAVARVCLPLTISMLVAAATGVTGQQAQAPPKPAPEAVFRGGVELVEVTVSVVDENGQAVTDLTIHDFE